MAPFLANHSLAAGSYKWMLYGDDDTVFYLDNVLRMLETLDHTMPYYITDHIWFLKSLTEGDLSPAMACMYSNDCNASLTCTTPRSCDRCHTTSLITYGF